MNNPKWGRPAKPDMTDEENSLTMGLGSREAAWILSDIRGAKKDRAKLVSHTWVLEQRKKRAPGMKPGFVGPGPLTVQVEANSVTRETQDPEPHQEGP